MWTEGGGRSVVDWVVKTRVVWLVVWDSEMDWRRWENAPNRTSPRCFEDARAVIAAPPGFSLLLQFFDFSTVYDVPRSSTNESELDTEALANALADALSQSTNDAIRALLLL
uniref:Uncharacterized protein n=1 Tax=Plectus sambesii TaxID=2011161 RepID=A0A914WBT4_9BILA